MPKLKILLFSILFLIAGITVLFFFSNNYKQVLAGDPLKVGDEVDVQIKFTSPKKIVSAEFGIKVDNGQLIGLRCAEGSTFSKTYGDATSCLLGHFEGGSMTDILAVARIKATAVGDLKVIGDGVLYDLDGNDVTGASYTQVLFSVESNTPPPADTEITCKNLVGIARDSAGTTYLLGKEELPKDFVGEVTLTCEGKSKGKTINFISFKFTKDNILVSAEGGTSSESILPTTCGDDEIALGFNCVVGTVKFNISGSGDYAASSKVCIVEGSTKTCSPNDNN